MSCCECPVADERGEDKPKCSEWCASEKLACSCEGNCRECDSLQECEQACNHCHGHGPSGCPCF